MNISLAEHLELPMERARTPGRYASWEKFLNQFEYHPRVLEL